MTNLHKGIVLGLLALGSTFAFGTRVYVTDSPSKSVKVYDAETGEYMGVFGTGFLTNILSLEQSPFDGYVYATGNGAVLRFDPYTGAYAGSIGTGFLSNPDDVAFSADGKMYVSDIRSGSNLIFRFNPTTGEYLGSLGNGFLGTTSSGISIATGPNDMIYAIGAGGVAVQKFVASTGEYKGAIGTGFFNGGRGLDLDSNGIITVGSYFNGSMMKFDSADSSFKGMYATGGFAPSIYASCLMPNGWSLVRSFSSGTEYVARFVPSTGEYKGIFAANSGLQGFGLAMETKAKVSGTITLEDYNWTSTLNVVFQVRNASNVVVDTVTVPVSPTGAYTFETYQRGTMYVAAKTTHFLTKRTATTVNIGRSGATGVNLTLINGDVDFDDEVGSTDFDTVVANFGNSAPDPADIDNDGEVGSSDFDIVVFNYGLAGD